MTTYKVTYSGNATRFRNFEMLVNADSERGAVENAYQQIMDENYFPQDDGSIKDCDGHTIAEQCDSTIEHDGGCFFAESIDSELDVMIYELMDGTFECELDKDIHGSNKIFNHDNLDELKEEVRQSIEDDIDINYIIK